MSLHYLFGKKEKVAEVETDGLCDGLYLAAGGRLLLVRDEIAVDVSREVASCLFEEVAFLGTPTVDDLFLLVGCARDVLSVVYASVHLDEYHDVWKGLRDGAVKPLHATVKKTGSPSAAIFSYEVSSLGGESPMDLEIKERIGRGEPPLPPMPGNLLAEIKAQREREIRKALATSTYDALIQKGSYTAGHAVPQVRLDNKDLHLASIDLPEIFTLELKLDTEMRVTREELSEVLTYLLPRYTLGGIIHAFFYELSWFGAPGEREDALREVQES